MEDSFYKYKYEDTEGVADILAIFASLEESFKEKHNDMTRCYDYTNSKLQLPNDIRKEFEEDGRPANSYTFISRVVKTLVSMENANRKGVMALGVTDKDNVQSWVITKVLQFYLKQGKFDYVRTRAAIDAIITSYGIVYNQFSYADDKEGEEIFEVKDPRKIYFDLNFADTSLKKCKHIIERNDMTIEEMIDKYALNNETLQKEILLKANEMLKPKDTKEKRKYVTRMIDRLLDGVGEILSVSSSSIGSTEDTQRHQKEWVDPSSGKFTILEVHERRMTRKMIFNYPELGQSEDVTELVLAENGVSFDEDKIKELKDSRDTRVFPKVELDKTPYISAYCPAFDLKLLDQPYPHKNNGNYAYTILFANDFHADLLNATGMVEELIDPQDDFNKAMNMRLELLARSLSKSMIMEDGAIEGFEHQWDSKKIGQYKTVNPGYLNKIKPEDDLNPPVEALRITQEMPTLIDEISTIGKAMFGQQESGKEGVGLFVAKKNQSERGFIHFTDNIDKFTVRVAENVWADIQYFVDEEKMIRISTDADKAEYLTVNERETVVEQGKVITKIKNDLSKGKYDIFVSTAPYTATAKELEFLKLSEFINLVKELDPEKAKRYLPILLKSTGTSYMEDILKIDEEENNNPQQQFVIQVQKVLQELEVKLKQLEIAGMTIDNKGKLLDNQGKLIEQRGEQLNNMEKAGTIATMVGKNKPKRHPLERGLNAPQGSYSPLQNMSN